MNVRGVDLDCILEYRLQQLHDRRVLRAELAGCRAEFDVGLLEVAFQRADQAADLLGAAIGAVDRFRERNVAYDRELDFPAKDAGKLVKREQVGRIGYPDKVSELAFLQHDRPEPPCRRLGKLAGDCRIELLELEVDVRQVELLRKRRGDLLLAREPFFDQDAPESLAGLLLALQRTAQLLGGNDLLRDEHVAQADSLRTGHLGTQRIRCRRRRRWRKW